MLTWTTSHKKVNTSLVLLFSLFGKCHPTKNFQIDKQNGSGFATTREVNSNERRETKKLFFCKGAAKKLTKNGENFAKSCASVEKRSVFCGVGKCQIGSRVWRFFYLFCFVGDISPHCLFWGEKTCLAQSRFLFTDSCVYFHFLTLNLGNFYFTS